MISIETIEKYIKVKALADQGSGGEKENAQRILAKLVREHPGLEKAVDKHLKARNKAEEEDPDVSPNEDPFSRWARQSANGQKSRFGGNWEEIFNFARAAVNNAYDFASHVANAWVGRQLAEDNVTTAVRETKAGNVTLTFRMPTTTIDYAVELNLVQKQAFRQVLHEFLDDHLDELIGSVEEDEAG